jgi:hypothetical protein
MYKYLAVLFFLGSSAFANSDAVPFTTRALAKYGYDCRWDGKTFYKNTENSFAFHLLCKDFNKPVFVVYFINEQSVQTDSSFQSLKYPYYSECYFHGKIISSDLTLERSCRITDIRE